MKRFLSIGFSRCEAFSLVEAVLSIGVMSFGFLALAPLLAVGMNGARVAQENRVSAELAAMLIEQARQGVASSNTFDSAGAPCAVGRAAYTVQENMTVAQGLNRLTLRIAPAQGGARIYADVFPTPPGP